MGGSPFIQKRTQHHLKLSSRSLPAQGHDYSKKVFLFVKQAVRYASFQHLMKLTQHPVAWVYEAWDGLLALLREGNNHQHAIAIQFLSTLARSAPQES